MVNLRLLTSSPTFLKHARGKTGVQCLSLVGDFSVKPKRRKLQAAQDRSESTEDHLERIQELVDQKGYARVSDIAVSLRLSRSAGSNMVGRLPRRGYGNYERDRGFTLTAEGRAGAHPIKVRHQRPTPFLLPYGL